MLSMIEKSSPDRTLRGWSALVLLALAGCGGVTREPSDGPEGSAPTADSGAPDPDSGAPIDDASPRGCGGSTGRTCPAAEYCFYSIAQACGAADATGMCVRRGEGGCPLIYLPVCGCDGRTYGNSCDAAMSGVSVASEGVCPSADAGVCQDGETKKVDCNTCTCQGGRWGCTIIACPPP